MQAEILFFAVVIIWGIAFRNKSETISYFGDPVYAAWFLLSISIFGYTPSVLQYAIRLAAICFGLLAVFTDGTITFCVPKRTPIVTLFIIYLVYGGVSVAWSVDALQTAVKVVELFVDVLVISKAVEIDGIDIAAKKLTKIVLAGCVLVEFYALAGFVVMNGTFFSASSGILGRHLTGVIVSADSLCGIMTLVICYYLNFRKGFWDNVILALAFVVLFLGQARTSLISVLIMLMIYFFRTNKKFFYVGLLGVLGVVAFYNWDTIYAYFVRGSTDENLRNMSGRTVMWGWARELIAERPLFGYGFGSGGEMVSTRIGMSSLHSGVYETLMGVGYVGFIQLIIIYVLTIIELVRNILVYGISKNVFEIMLLIDLTIRTYVSGGIGGWQSQQMMIFLIIIFGYSHFGNLGTLASRCEAKYEEEFPNGESEH